MNSLGITAIRFTTESRLDDAIVAAVISFPPPCNELVWSSAQQDGNPLIITENGTTTTLSLVTDFWPTFDTNEIGVLNFMPGDGAYDFCISDLEFLDEQGNAVVP